MPNQTLLNDDIFQLLGLQHLPQDRKLPLLQKISELVLKRICLRVMDTLADKDTALKAQAEDIFTNGTEDQKLDFIQKNTDLPKLIEEELVLIKQDLINDLKAAGLYPKAA